MKRPAARLLLLVAVCSTHFPAGAVQRIAGTIRDSERKAIRGAIVSSPQATAPASSTSAGEFVLSIRDGSTSPVTLNVRRHGFEDLTELVEIPQNKPLTLTLVPAAQTQPKPDPPPVGAERDTFVLKEGLRSTDARERIAALKALAAKGRAAIAMAPTIAAALRDPDAEVQLEAAATLEKLRPDSAVVNDALLLALTTRSENLQCAAANALRAIGPSSPSFLRALNEIAADEKSPILSRLCAARTSVELTKTPSNEAKAGIIAALLKGHRAAMDLTLEHPQLIRDLAAAVGESLGAGSSPIHMLEPVLEAISKLGIDEQQAFTKGYAKALDVSLIRFHYVRPERVSEEAYHLFREAVRAWLARPLLIPCDELLHYGVYVDHKVKWGILDAAEAMQFALDNPGVERLHRCTWQEAAPLVEILGNLGPAAVEPLRRAFANENRQTRESIARMLYVASGGKDDEAIEYLVRNWRPDMIETLRQLPVIDDDRLIVAVVRTVMIAPYDVSVLSTIQGSPGVRRSAAHRLMTSRSDVVCFAGVELLEGLPLTDDDFNALFKVIVHNTDWNVVLRRDFAAMSRQITGINESAKQVPDVLAAVRRLLVQAAPASVTWINAKLLEGEPLPFTQGYPSELLKVLAELREAALPALPALRILLRSAGMYDDEAIVIIGTIGPEAAAAVPDLIAVVKNRLSANREAAARSLGKIGPSAAQAIPALESLSREREISLRTAATAALSQIRVGR